MTTPTILSLDLSLTAPGYCDCEGCGTFHVPAKLRGVERLIDIRDQVKESAAGFCDLVVIEGYSYGSKGQAVINIGELGGVIRVALHELHLPVVEIPPACLKRYATGRGNASKDDVLQAGVMRSGHTFVDNNACDAWWLWCMAMEHYCPGDAGVPKMPAANREALGKINWVVLEGT